MPDKFYDEIFWWFSIVLGWAKDHGKIRFGGNPTD